MPAIKPLGVGVNLQPNAVRELYDLGLAAALPKVGVKTRDYGFYTRKGLEIWTEPRGTWAGYNWPQYSVHRGQLQMLLYQTLMERAGADCLMTDARAVGFENGGDGARLHLRARTGGAGPNKARWWSAPTAFIRRSVGKCIRMRGRRSGAAR